LFDLFLTKALGRQLFLLGEKALLDAASEKNGTIEATFRSLEKSMALIHVAFMPFGAQNRQFWPKGTKREKRPD
jgi:hypothetical protein